MSSSISDYYYDDPTPAPNYTHDETGSRFAWKIASWILVALTLLLNIIVIGTIVLKRNFDSVVNKAILTLAIVDLLYGLFVSPFFVENYIDVHWEQSLSYCKFFEYVFTFHDLFVPLVLICLSAYVSLKFAGANQALKFKRHIYLGLFLLVLLFSLFLAIPSAVHSHIYNDNNEDQGFLSECRSKDTYSYLLAYFLASSLLFCFTMSFLFSLCIMGSPLLKDAYDDWEIYRQRWWLLLTLSFVNGCYIVSGFLFNFKEFSRAMWNCCEIREPFFGTNTLTYDIWSFTLLISEPFLRPLVCLSFYFKYLRSHPR